jgi:serine/threonine protein kinase
MPYVPCESLQQRLDRQGRLAALDVVRIAWQVACGLAAAHAQGLVHRDIKPANMLLEKGVDRVLLTDFGLARAVDDASLTRTGVIAGTPQYMSPEQARGEAVDHRSDLFSLGSMLYAMCTGRVPFRAETSYGILRRITDTEPRPIREINPGIPEWLVTIVAKLHAKDPAGRFASADELAKLLEQCLAHVQQPTAVPLPDGIAATQLASVETRLTATAAHFSSSRFRRPRVVGSLFAGLLVLAAVAGIAIRIHQDAGDERSKSPAESAVSAAPNISENEARGQTTMSVWQDGAVEQIRDLDEATDQFETSAGQLWDHQTSSARSNDPTNAIQPSNQQVTK